MHIPNGFHFTARRKRERTADRAETHVSSEPSSPQCCKMKDEGYNISWRPTATFENIRLRAEILAKIRAFFAVRDILEVETPLLGRSTITDPNIQSFTSQETLYLQTSPEFAMKRLLAAGSGSIFQIGKAFRNEECGRLHNPEFTILEWYHLGFDHHDLMGEMDEFLYYLLELPKAERLSYQQAFKKYLAIDPLSCDIQELRRVALQRGLNDFSELDQDGWLNILFANFIEPNLGIDRPVFIYDFPLSQAALARINENDPSVASRFEVFVNGIELGNGFHELANAIEQRQRFLRDLEKRQQLNLSQPPLDENFLAAIDYLPDCAGVAIGIDRLLMIMVNTKNIEDVIAFPIG
jgi:elongation factor P--(R)-beta-lysine ligase